MAEGRKRDDARTGDGPPVADADSTLRDDLMLFLVVAALGVAASFVSINIPHADAHLDGRFAFGLIGFAMLRRWWLAGLLVVALSTSGFHTLPFSVVIPANLMFMIPMMAATRAIHARAIRPIPSLAAFGLAWVAWVLVCYQVIASPIVSLVLAYLDGRSLLAAIVTGWNEQPLLIESLLVAIVSGAGMIVLRSRSMIANSQHELAVTLQSIGDAVIATDVEGRVTRMNPEACRLTGWPAEEAMGRPLGNILVLVNAKTSVPVTSPIAQVLHAGRAVGLANHTTLIGRTGERYQIADSAAPISDTGGGMLGVVMVFRDVTREYDAREALAHGKRQLDLALDAAGMGTWDWDIRTGHLEWVGHQAALFGLKPEDFDGRIESTQALVHPDDWDGTIKGALATSRNGAPYDQTFRTVWPDGSEHWLRAVAKLVRDGSGAPWRVIGTTQDITDRKLAEDQLQATVDALGRSNVELERFAYVASHDLQEPIRSMVAYSQLLRSRYGERLDADAEAFLGFIIDGAKRMQDQVLDLLECSRVNSGGRAFGPVEMSTVVASTCANLDDAIKTAGAAIEVCPMPVVVGDAVQLISMMQNLIGNAVKFRRPGVKHEVRVSASSPAHGTVTIEVADNGVGIAPEDQERIFEIFKRLHTTTGYPGTGIGLTLAKRIAERHGGSITLDSVPGEGSRFRIILPIPPGSVA